EHRLTVQTDGRVEQTVAAANTLASMPEQLAVAADIQCGLEMAAGKTLVGGRPAEGDDIPVEQAGVALQVYLCVQLGLGAGIDDGLLRQPFQSGAGFDAQAQVLSGDTGSAIPLGCARAGELHPGVFASLGRDVQNVTAGNAARRVDDDVLA